MSEDYWPRSTFASALMVIDNSTLVKAAGLHVQPDYEGADRHVRPSLVGQDCELQMVKKFRGHGPQPHVIWTASKAGKPNVNTNITFARGFLGEGMVVAAFKLYAEMTGDYEVLGCAPELVFQFDDWEAHPDLLVQRKGKLEILQIKTPSVFAFDRAEKATQASEFQALEYYRKQMVCEMHVGRLMGIEISRSWLFMFTWEGYLPSMDKSDEARVIVVPLDWEPAMGPYAENLAEEVRVLNKGVEVAGQWPRPANDESNYKKWPCSYCQYARTRSYEGQAICTENHKWETPQLEGDRLRLIAEQATEGLK